MDELQPEDAMAKALSKFAPFERADTLGVRVRDKLRETIMAGHFGPGDKLTLRAVASSLGVSLTPAREALFNLAAEGVLEMGPNGSIYIPKMTVNDIRELTKVRMSLEGLAAAEATSRLSAEDIIQISSFNDQLIEANQAKDFERLIQLNWNFHFHIYAAANMPVLLKMIESCWLRCGSYVNIIYPDFAKTDAGILNHIAIIREIRKGDAVAVAVAVRRDIEFSAEAFVAAVSKRDEAQQAKSA
jgi:DNA-binding GntR family transcriptional regulator